MRDMKMNRTCWHTNTMPISTTAPSRPSSLTRNFWSGMGTSMQRNLALLLVIKVERASFINLQAIYVIGYVKTGLIAGVRNCSYRPFLSAKSIFVNFLFS